MGHCLSRLSILFSKESLWMVEDSCGTSVLCTLTEALLPLFVYFSVFELWLLGDVKVKLGSFLTFACYLTKLAKNPKGGNATL